MLDTVREFVAERAGDLAAAELRHAHYFVGYCERLATEALPRPPARLAGAARGRARQSPPRLRAPASRRRRSTEALRVAIAFAEALPWDAHAHEVRGWLMGGLNALPEDALRLRARALYWDGRLAIAQGRFAEAEPRLRAALSAAGEAGEARHRCGGTDLARPLGDPRCESGGPPSWVMPRSPRRARAATGA